MGAKKGYHPTREFKKGYKRSKKSILKQIETYKQKYENNPPLSRFKKGYHYSLKTEFKKGHIPWNKNKKRTDTFKEKHWNWQGGITSLLQQIRNLPEMIIWRNKIFKRDNYTCQECFKQGCYLEAHHIKTLSKILANFLKKYSQFSLMEDKETLLRLAITYKPFWKISNGKALCKKCHNKKRDWMKRNDKGRFV